MGVFSDLKPKNSVSRNGFDLSRRSVFSAKNGQILPVFCQYTLPNSDYRIDVQQLLRTQPLQTAAFTGFSINYDFAFVPFNQLYSSFNQFIGQRADKFLANQPVHTKIPLLNLDTLFSGFINYFVYDFFVSRLTGSYSQTIQPSLVGGCPFRAFSFNFSDSCFVPDFIRLLDLYGYCNLLPWFKVVTDALLSQLGMSEWTWHNFSNRVSTLFDSDYYSNVLVSIDDLLSLGSSGERPILKLPSIGTFNLFPVLAYNKIFYEFYRNKYYDEFVELSVVFDDEIVHKQYTYNLLFNYDDYVSASSFEDYRIISMFALHLHTYRKDLFTGVLPSMQFGDVSMALANDLGDRQSRYFLDAQLANNPGTISDVYVSDNGVLTAPYLSSGSPGQEDRVRFALSPNIAISVLESRRADAMQRFRERMMRAGDSTKSIFEAHGWEKPKSEQFHEPIFLGSFDGRLDINTVAATGESGDVELGQLGANGVGVVQGSEINFHSSDFGVIIGVMYIVKDSEYNSFGTDRQLCLSEAFDFPYPEFQNISLQPIVYRQLQGLKYETLNGTVDDGQYTPLGQNDVLGYLPGYMEYKTAIDKVHGEFCSGEFAWEPDVDNGNALYPKTFVGMFSDWCTPRSKVLQPDLLSFLYQQKDIVDNIFRVAQTEHQETDPFLINAYFKCLAVEPLSVIGLPV